MALGVFWLVMVVLGTVFLVRGRKKQTWLARPVRTGYAVPCSATPAWCSSFWQCFIETALIILKKTREIYAC